MRASLQVLVPLRPSGARAAGSAGGTVRRHGEPCGRGAQGAAVTFAGPAARLAVEGAIHARTTPGSCPGSFTVPRFTTSRRAPSTRAATLMAAPPRAKFFTISPVTACGKADTFSIATPWSAANTAITAWSTAGRSTACNAASRTASPSSCPRAPGGLVSCPWRASASASMSRLRGLIASEIQSAFIGFLSGSVGVRLR